MKERVTGRGLHLHCHLPDTILAEMRGTEVTGGHLRLASLVIDLGLRCVMIMIRLHEDPVSYNAFILASEDVCLISESHWAD